MGQEFEENYEIVGVLGKVMNIFIFIEKSNYFLKGSSRNCSQSKGHKNFRIYGC